MKSNNGLQTVTFVAMLLLLVSCSNDRETATPLVGLQSQSLNTDKASVVESTGGQTPTHLVAIDRAHGIIERRIFDSPADLAALIPSLDVQLLNSRGIVMIAPYSAQFDAAMGIIGDRSDIIGVQVAGFAVLVLKSDDTTDASWSCVKCVFAPDNDPCHDTCDDDDKDQLIEMEMQ